jgi:ABC-type amino acid transport system permease subunit
VISDWILTQLIAANEAQNKNKATKAMEDERFNAIQLDFIEITVIFHKVKVLFGRFVTNVGRTSIPSSAAISDEGRSDSFIRRMASSLNSRE